jgi:hypothetical protein
MGQLFQQLARATLAKQQLHSLTLPTVPNSVYFVKNRSGNSSTGRDMATGILHNLQPVFGGEASTAPTTEKTFLNDVDTLRCY